MIVSEYNFTDYYHKYITIEADELTEQLNDIVKIRKGLLCVVFFIL